MKTVEILEDLKKAMSAGNYDAAPSQLVQGSALQIEDLDPVIKNVTFGNPHLKLAKMCGKTSVKATTVQWDRQLSYGIFGGSATTEGNIGVDETSDFVRATAPMCFYSHTRKVTVASTMVATVDGQKSDERAAKDAALKIAGDIEFDCLRGMDDFSNAGSFDGNPALQAQLPNIHGLALQVRQSDSQVNTRDLMFSEYGSDDSVVLTSGTVLTQDKVEDAAVRSVLNFGTGDTLLVDPIVLSAYNKITFGKERIILAGSPQNATGGDLTKQWVSGGTVSIEASQFLRGKAKPARFRAETGLGTPSIATAASSTGNSIPAGTYYYYVTAVNEKGESTASTAVSQVVASGEKVVVTITHSTGTFRHFNVYRSAAGGTAASAKFIGRVIATAGSATTLFTDLGNKLPGFVTGVLVSKDTFEFAELCPFSRLKLGLNQLALPEAFFQFTTLKVTEPRKNVIIDSLKGTLS